MATNDGQLEVVFFNGKSMTIQGAADVLRTILDELANGDDAMGEVKADDGRAFTYLLRGVDVSHALLSPIATGIESETPIFLKK